MKCLLSYLKSPGIRTIRSDRKISIFQVPDRISGCGNLFVKVYRLETLGQRFKSVLRWRANGRRDLDINQRLKTIGIPVPEPVGACNDFSCRLSAWYSIFANQWLDNAFSLRDYIVKSRDRKKSAQRASGEVKSITVPISPIDEKWPAPDQSALLCRRLGEFVRHLHDNGVSNTDLNAGNIMVHKAGKDGYRFFLVDYERVTLRRSVTGKLRIHNLAQLAASMKGLAPTIVTDLAKGYGALHRISGQADGMEALHRQSDELANRWKKREDDNFKAIYRYLQK